MPKGSVDLQRKLGRLNMRLKLHTPRVRELCIILGAMKCGTTFLYRHLEQHPEITPNLVRKEPNSLLKPQIDDRAYFRQWLPHPFRRQVAIEASTNYSKYPGTPDVAERIAGLPCRTSFIYMVRDPVERIESHVAHSIARGRSGKDRKRLEDFERQIDASNYGMQLARYRSVLPDAPLLVIDFDDVRADPAGVLRRTCRFLGIDEGFRFEMLGPQNQRREAHGARGFRIADPVKAQIRARLAEDMRRFGDEYGIDVAKWGFGPVDAVGAGGAGAAADST